MKLSEIEVGTTVYAHHWGSYYNKHYVPCVVMSKSRGWEQEKDGRGRAALSEIGHYVFKHYPKGRVVRGAVHTSAMIAVAIQDHTGEWRPSIVGQNTVSPMTEQAQEAIRQRFDKRIAADRADQERQDRKLNFISMIKECFGIKLVLNEEDLDLEDDEFPVKLYERNITMTQEDFTSILSNMGAQA